MGTRVPHPKNIYGESVMPVPTLLTCKRFN